MSFFDTIKSVAGTLTGGNTDLGSLAQGALNLIQQNGGISGLQEKFQSQGLGDTIKSWIGTGTNQAIDANQIQQVLGSDAIASLAQKAGIDPSAVSSKVAEFLPGLIDKLTPNGKIEQNDGFGLNDVMNIASSLFGKKA